ncbi:MAG TPA: response regulator transcription factor [Acidimicrobiales bacterium]|nr:response regulator transcription factor [Acidimicrobiales bacterium]
MEPAGLIENDLFFVDGDLPEDPLRVVLGDDNGLYRRGLLTALEDETDLEVVAEAGPGADLVAAVRALAPDIVVCSLSMGGNAGGVETTYALTEVMPLVRVAVLTTDQDPQAKRVAAVRAGATGEIDKVDALEEAARVIRGVHGGWPVLSPMTWVGVAAEVGSWLVDGDSVNDREHGILAALASGGSWDGAAESAGLSAEAARNQVRNVLARARAAGYPEAAEAAADAGLIAHR